jgi:hypothetical protein
VIGWMDGFRKCVTRGNPTTTCLPHNNEKTTRRPITHLRDEAQQSLPPRRRRGSLPIIRHHRRHRHHLPTNSSSSSTSSFSSSASPALVWCGCECGSPCRLCGEGHQPPVALPLHAQDLGCFVCVCGPGGGGLRLVDSMKDTTQHMVTRVHAQAAMITTHDAPMGRPSRRSSPRKSAAVADAYPGRAHTGLACVKQGPAPTDRSNCCWGGGHEDDEDMTRRGQSVAGGRRKEGIPYT